CEHTGAFESGAGNIRLTNAVAGFTWYATGAKLADIVVKAMDAFGVPTFPESQPAPPGEIGRYYRYAPSVQIMNSGYVWHSDEETAETLSAGGMAAVTRTYAKVIADTDAIELHELRQVLAPRPSTGGGR